MEPLHREKSCQSFQLRLRALCCLYMGGVCVCSSGTVNPLGKKCEVCQDIIKPLKRMITILRRIHTEKEHRNEQIDQYIYQYSAQYTAQMGTFSSLGHLSPPLPLCHPQAHWVQAGGRSILFSQCSVTWRKESRWCRWLWKQL